jgi:hypothetical protein
MSLFKNVRTERITNRLQGRSIKVKTKRVKSGINHQLFHYSLGPYFLFLYLEGHLSLKLIKLLVAFDDHKN